MSKQIRVKLWIPNVHERTHCSPVGFKAWKTDPLLSPPKRVYLFLVNSIEAMSFAIPLDARSSKVIHSSCQSLWRRANARNVSFLTLNGDQFTFSTLNYLSYSPTDAAPQFLEKLTRFIQVLIETSFDRASSPVDWAKFNKLEHYMAERSRWISDDRGNLKQSNLYKY